MKALVFQGAGDIRCADIAKPSTPKVGWATVRVEAAGLCGSDIQKILAGTELSAGKQSHVLGHEIAGIVAACGAGVDRDWLGRRVAIEPLVPCRTCGTCGAGRTNLCPDLVCIGRELDGGFAEQVNAPVESLHPLPGAMPFSAGVMADGLAVILHTFGVVSLAQGDRVAILGDGPIGLLCAEYVCLLGGEPVMFTKHPERAQLAETLGVTESFCISGDQMRNRMPALKDSFPFVVEAVGGKQSDSLELAFDLLMPGGSILVIGAFDVTASLPLRVGRLFRKEGRVISRKSYTTGATDSQFRRALELIASAKIRVEPLISHRLPLRQVGEMLELIRGCRGNRAVKVVFEPQT